MSDFSWIAWCFGLFLASAALTALHVHFENYGWATFIGLCAITWGAAFAAASGNVWTRR